MAFHAYLFTNLLLFISLFLSFFFGLNKNDIASNVLFYWVLPNLYLVKLFFLEVYLVILFFFLLFSSLKIVLLNFFFKYYCYSLAFIACAFVIHVNRHHPRH